jgi:hypothetical protein
VRDAVVHKRASRGAGGTEQVGLTLNPFKLRVGIQDEDFIKLNIGHEVRPTHMWPRKHL